MKAAFLVLLLVVAAAATDDHHGGHHHEDYVVKTQEDLVRFRELCSTQLGVPADLVEKYKRWEYPNDVKTQCYMKCVFEQFGLFGENGFDVHRVHHQLVGSVPDHTDETHQKIDRCADKNTEGSDACAWAYRGGMCFIKENLQLVQKSVKSVNR